ncbi:MAG: hypothetical protein JXB39_11455 [Deltaproteobacteria bacterium]|nr:hypothetical protein [Deltaproteobacteria bacterium]
MRTRLLLPASALLAASAVLVADSVGPTCELYKGWAVDVTYTTDCAGGDAGAFSASAGDLSYDAVGMPQPDDVRFVQTEGELVLSILAISYDTTACDDGSGTGTFTGLVFEFGETGETGMGTTTWQCSGWDLGAETQDLTCYPSTGGFTCTLALTSTATG